MREDLRRQLDQLELSVTALSDQVDRRDKLIENLESRVDRTLDQYIEAVNYVATQRGVHWAVVLSQFWNADFRATLARIYNEYLQQLHIRETTEDPHGSRNG